MKFNLDGKDYADVAQKSLDLGTVVGVYILCKVMTEKDFTPSKAYFTQLATAMAYQIEEKSGMPAEDFMKFVGDVFDTVDFNRKN